MLIKHFRNGIFFKSSTKRFTEFTNCNLSRNQSSLPYFLSTMLKSMSFHLTVPNRTSDGKLDFSLQLPEFYSSIQFEIRKDWPVDVAKM